MQEGLKRKITNKDLYPVIRKCFDLPSEGEALNSGVYFLTDLELNAIDSGKDINTIPDLSISGEDLPIDAQPVSIKTSFYKLEIECLGTEIQDEIDLLLSDEQFYLQGGCEIQYYATGPYHLSTHTAGNSTHTSFLNIEGTEIKTDIIQKNKFKIINLGKDTNRPLDDGVPNDASYPDPPLVLYNGTYVPGYIKEWGPGTKFNGILSVKGRVKYRILQEDNLNYAEPLSSGNDPYNPSFKILNGLPNNYTLSSVPPGSEKSSYGTRIIYKGGSELYGDQRHEDYMYEQVFRDPDSLYYHPFFYGQPIIRYDKDFLVLYNYYLDEVDLGDLLGSIKYNTFAFLSLEKKRKNNYPYGHIAEHFTEAGVHSRISTTGIPQESSFQQKLKDQTRVYKGNDVDDWMGEINVDNRYINWAKIRGEGRLRYYGLRAGGQYGGPDGNSGEPNVGTIGYGQVPDPGSNTGGGRATPPKKGTSNAFYGYGSHSFPWE